MSLTCILCMDQQTTYIFRAHFNLPNYANMLDNYAHICMASTDNDHAGHYVIHKLCFMILLPGGEWWA